jgi:hypothetical protein
MSVSPASASEDGFRPGHSPVDYAPDAGADGRIAKTKEKLGEAKEEAEIQYEFLKEDAPHIEEMAHERTEAAVEANPVGEWFLNHGPEQIVSVAIGIMATLMIGVVVIGKIDTFTPSLSGTWSNTSDNVSQQSSQTFDFLNLVPFIIVALFVLGLMMSRMG